MPLLSQWGGKRAVAKQVTAPLKIILGGHRRFVATVSHPIERLVFVCAGNICRSPFGEFVARRAGVPAISMGLKADPGTTADPVAMQHAQLHGIDMRHHRASRFDTGALRKTDLLLGFELWHVQALEQALAHDAPTVRLLGAFLGLSHFHIHDPYGLHDSYFASCFTTIDQGVCSLIRQIKLPRSAEAACES